MITKTEAIRNFLLAKTHSDLASLYHKGMECQVNVAQDGGTRVEGDYHGRKWHGWTDGTSTWKSYRIPYNAATEPTYTDSDQSWDLSLHAEGIGMTGWDWEALVSRWVAFDFDALIGHSEKHGKKLTPAELQTVITAAEGIEWVTIRKSTSGRGLHLYVMLPNVQTSNHNEHAALARAILGQMSAITGFDFVSKVDICGGNMWVWHRKMAGTQGLQLVKQGSVLPAPPPNWRDHLLVVKGNKRKSVPQVISESANSDPFEELTGKHRRIDLDAKHKELIEFLRNTGAQWWWDQDHHMLVTHTFHLSEAHSALKMKGFFATMSTGKEKGQDHNCFLFPMRNGAWSVRRFSQGVKEHDSWDQDGAGWTRCFLNKEPDLSSACRAYGGVEDPKGGFVFREAEMAAAAARLLGVTLHVATWANNRETTLIQHKDGRLLVEVKRENHDNAGDMPGWLAKGNKPWSKIYNADLNQTAEPEVSEFDEVVRHLINQSGEDTGWTIHDDKGWRDEPIQHVKMYLQSLNLQSKDVTTTMGTLVAHCWRLVSKPFMPEYPGDREWNRDATQLRFTASDKEREARSYPTWLSVLAHCGKGLDEAVAKNDWCQSNGLRTGSDYLKCWIASMFQYPEEPLPYLFFYGEQGTGKSIFPEAISLLLTQGYTRADAALISQSGFNAELEGKILCVIEEVDLHSNKNAYNRIKDWVTGREILIHKKGSTPYHTVNLTHWIQCANDYKFCPIFQGDTRIVVCNVPTLEKEIPKREIIQLLEAEAPDFVAEILQLELPRSPTRLNIPVVETSDKIFAAQANKSDLAVFLEEMAEPCDGSIIKFSVFYDRFMEWIDPNELHKWSKTRVGRELPRVYVKGRSTKDNAQHYVLNIKWRGDPTVAGEKVVINNEGFFTIGGA